MKKTRVNLVVGNQNVDLGRVINLINNTSNDFSFLYLTTHHLFNTERTFIRDAVQKKIIFKSFADFLTDKEMEWCDKKASSLEKKMSLPQHLRLRGYYTSIKEVKNKLVYKNLKKNFFPKKCFLLADGLGIDKNFWIGNGFVSQLISDNLGVVVRLRNKLATWIKMVQELFLIFRKGEKVFVLKKGGNKYLFIGSINRLRPRLGKNIVSTYQLKTRLNLKSLISFIILLIKKNLKQDHLKMLHLLCFKDFEKIIKKEGVCSLASSIHEYKISTARLAKKLNLKLVLFQDGFLPGNYTSRLYHYLFDVDKFLVWDELALELFKKNGLVAEISDFFNLNRLPKIKYKNKVSKILVATSGAGDWTALKNRSDEDLMVEIFAAVAKMLPGIQIVYRCHPLWTHPQHQGVNSIRRVVKYFDDLGLKNIRVSGESIKQSEKNRGLWVPAKSMTEDIKKSDIVFGEHSIAMIDAAEKGKMFASVNVTGRRNLFVNYTRLGFTHLTNLQQIVDFIDGLTKNKMQTKQYNQSVKVYNSKYVN